MKGTGEKVTSDELAELRALAAAACEAPVITLAIGRPTFAESAMRQLQDRVNEIAAAHGHQRPDWNYGVHAGTGEILE